MSFVKINKDGWLSDKNDKSFYPVGINYVASYICTNFWQDFRQDVIKADLQKIAELGFNVVRIPMFWGYMEPEQGQYNPDIFPKFNLFLQWCKELDIYIMPWFLVGVATRDYDVPFRNKRPFFTGDMVQVAKEHIQHFIKHYDNEEQIFMWDLCDEPEYYNRHEGAEQWPFNRLDLKTWVQTLYDGVKEIDSNHLVTLGFGHIGSENFGYHVQDMASILDLMVVTCYPLGVTMDAASVLRNNYFLPFYIAFDRPHNNAVLTCEAPGFSSVMFSENVIGQYFKSCLYSNLAEGSMGVLPWCYNDFSKEIWHECPLEDYVYEPNFGIITNDGRLKPSGQELRSFAKIVDELNITEYCREKPQIAIIIPRDYYQNIPTSFRRIYTLYLLLKSSNIGNVNLVWQGEPLDEYNQVFVGDTSGFTSSYWDSIRTYVKNGGKLAMFFDLPTGLSAYFNNFFGLVVENPVADFTTTAVPVKNGFFDQLDSKNMVSKRKTHLVVTPVEAKVILECNDGTPLYLQNHYGSGTASLITSPLLDGLLDINENEFQQAVAWDIIRHETSEINQQQIVTTKEKGTEVTLFRHIKNNTCLVLVSNHNNYPVTEQLTVKEGYKLERILQPTTDGKLDVICFDSRITLEPCGTVILELSY